VSHVNSVSSRAVVKRADGWISGPLRLDAPSVRLFCLPYAGGAASIYEPWRDAFGAGVEVCAIEPPGRQTRLREPAYTRLDLLVEALATAIADELDVPYALFGHSMGSLLAFELARELRRRGAAEPCALFVAGGAAPRLPNLKPPVHAAPDAQVFARLRELGGLPAEVHDEPELMRLFLPTIRADFALFETYEYRPQPPLDCPVVAFTGSEDREITPTRLAPWAEETTGRFEYHVLPGGHFFLRTSQTALLDLIRSGLAAHAYASRPIPQLRSF
jgi:surfactin synthase thioesterase subunit